MANNNSNGNSNGSKKRSQAANQYLNNMKYEIANEVGVNLKQGYNGDLTSKEAGTVGGYMVKKMIKQAEQNMSNK